MMVILWQNDAGDYSGARDCQTPQTLGEGEREGMMPPHQSTQTFLVRAKVWELFLGKHRWNILWKGL